MPVLSQLLPRSSCRSRRVSYGPQGSWMIPPILSSTSRARAKQPANSKWTDPLAFPALQQFLAAADQLFGRFDVGQQLSFELLQLLVA